MIRGEDFPIKWPLRVRMVISTEGGEDLFETAPVIVAPGEMISWYYPPDGLDVEIGAVTLTPKPY